MEQHPVNVVQHIYKVKAAVVLYLTSESSDVEFSRHDWESIGEVINVLQPFYDVTVEMSGEKYITSSKCIPMVKLRTRAVMALETELLRSNPMGMAFKLVRSLQTGLKKRFGLIEEVEPLALATLLDPRYGKLGFKDDEKARLAISMLCKEAFNVGEEVASSAAATKPTVPTPTASTASVRQSFDKEVEERNKSKGNRATATVAAEICAYLESKNLTSSLNALTWWNKNKATFPTLFQLGKKYHAIPGTSVLSERAFSSAGNIIMNKRARLNDETASMLVFLNATL